MNQYVIRFIIVVLPQIHKTFSNIFIFIDIDDDTHIIQIEKKIDREREMGIIDPFARKHTQAHIHLYQIFGVKYVPWFLVRL